MRRVCLLGLLAGLLLLRPEMAREDVDVAADVHVDLVGREELRVRLMEAIRFGIDDILARTGTKGKAE